MPREHAANITQGKVSILSSLMNYFALRMFYTGFLPIHSFIDATYTAGYDGLEWHSMQGLIIGLQMRQKVFDQYTRDAICSLHQSWSGEISLEGILTSRNKLVTIASALLLPESIASLHLLNTLQMKLQKKLPIVVYPTHATETAMEKTNFSEITFQPTPRLMHAWGVTTIPELISASKNKGYAGFTLDLFHFRTEKIPGILLDCWQQSLPQLLPFTKEIHVSVGRVDMMQRVVNTQQEFRDLLEKKGTLTAILREIKHFGWKGRIVTEIPAGSLTHIGSPKLFVTPKHFLDTHKRVVSVLQDILA